MPRQKRVALLIDTATSWGSGLIEGVAEYALQARNWSFFYEPRGKYERMTLPAGWSGDGVIARITHQSLATELIECGAPAVNVSWYRFGEHLIPRCTCDETAVATMALRYFLDSGFRNFAYCGSTLRSNFDDRCGAAFVQQVSAAGRHCERFAPQYEQFSRLPWEVQLSELGTWLESLPRPTALLAFDDVQGRQVTDACEQAGLAVPHDIAVLGGEHDELSSRISRPPLSSVDQSPQEVGRHAAAMLDRLMRGETLTSNAKLVSPRRIIIRHSTDTVALSDDLLADAIRYIKDHAHEELRITDILRQVPLSRRSLEKGFRKYLGRSPREEIRRIRVEKALQLLCDTTWPVNRVAAACGFDRPELLTRAFRRELRTTPSAYRKRATAS